MKKKVAAGLIAIGLFASFCAGYSVNNQPIVETMTTPESEQDIKETSQGEEPAEVENGKIVNNFQVQQGEVNPEENPQGDIVVKEELPEFYEEMVYNEETGIYESVFYPVGSETNTSKEKDPTEGMTLEEFEAWMLDTSDAPKPGDPIPEDNNQGNTGGSHGGLTEEQLADLLDVKTAGEIIRPGDPRYHDGGGTGGGTGSGIVRGDEIQWN